MYLLLEDANLLGRRGLDDSGILDGCGLSDDLVYDGRVLLGYMSSSALCSTRLDPEEGRTGLDDGGLSVLDGSLGGDGNRGSLREGR